MGTLLDIIDLYWVFLAPLVTMAYIYDSGISLIGPLCIFSELKVATLFQGKAISLILSGSPLKQFCFVFILFEKNAFIMDKYSL